MTAALTAWAVLVHALAAAGALARRMSVRPDAMDRDRARVRAALASTLPVVVCPFCGEPATSDRCRELAA